MRDYKTAESQKAVKLAEHRTDRVENLLCEESQAQKTRSAGEITEAIKEMMLNSASSGCCCRAEFERTVLKRELRTAAVEDGFGEWKVFSFLKEYWKNPPKANDSRKCGVNVLSAKLYLSALFYFQSCVTHSD